MNELSTLRVVKNQTFSEMIAEIRAEQAAKRAAFIAKQNSGVKK